MSAAEIIIQPLSPVWRQLKAEAKMSSKLARNSAAFALTVSLLSVGAPSGSMAAGYPPLPTFTQEDCGSSDSRMSDWILQMSKIVQATSGICDSSRAAQAETDGSAKYNRYCASVTTGQMHDLFEKQAAEDEQQAKEAAKTAQSTCSN